MCENNSTIISKRYMLSSMMMIFIIGIEEKKSMIETIMKYY